MGIKAYSHYKIIRNRSPTRNSVPNYKPITQFNIHNFVERIVLLAPNPILITLWIKNKSLFSLIFIKTAVKNRNKKN